MTCNTINVSTIYIMCKKNFFSLFKELVVLFKEYLINKKNVTKNCNIFKKST